MSLYVLKYTKNIETNCTLFTTMHLNITNKLSLYTNICTKYYKHIFTNIHLTSEWLIHWAAFKKSFSSPLDKDYYIRVGMLFFLGIQLK